MSAIARFSASIEHELLDRSLRIAKRRGWGNPSEAVRHLIRDAMVREKSEANAEVVGTIMLVYDHHKRELGDKFFPPKRKCPAAREIKLPFPQPPILPPF